MENRRFKGTASIVTCSTKLEAKELLRIADNRGYTWGSGVMSHAYGTSLLNAEDTWDRFEEVTTYHFLNNIDKCLVHDANDGVSFREFCLNEFIQSDLYNNENSDYHINNLDRQALIQAKTLEEAQAVLKIAHDAGFRWCNGKSYLNANNWESYGDQTVYEIKTGSYCNRQYFKERQLDRKIISAQEFLVANNVTIETMTPSEPLNIFKPGDLVTSKVKPFEKVIYVTENDSSFFWGVIIRGEIMAPNVKSYVFQFKSSQYQLVDDLEISLKIKTDKNI